MSLPDWSRDKLERTARDHADWLAWERGWEPGEWANVDRVVVNMLRHEFTGYDNTQTQAAHRAANEAIAARYPWLAEECARQIAERADTEEANAALAAMVAEIEREDAERRRARSAASHDAIKALAIGMTVTAKVKGYNRTGTVTKLGRNRVTVAYRIASGAERTALLYASEVVPALVGA